MSQINFPIEFLISHLKKDLREDDFTNEFVSSLKQHCQFKDDYNLLRGLNNCSINYQIMVNRKQTPKEVNKKITSISKQAEKLLRSFKELGNIGHQALILNHKNIAPDEVKDMLDINDLNMQLMFVKYAGGIPIKTNKLGGKQKDTPARELFKLLCDVYKEGTGNDIKYKQTGQIYEGIVIDYLEACLSQIKGARKDRARIGDILRKELKV